MKITRVELVTRNVSATATYYQEVLGLPVIRTGDEAEVQAGHTLLSFRQDPTATGDHHYAFLIDETRFTAARAFLEHGPGLLTDDGKVDLESEPTWNAHSLYFPGPDGSILELIARRDLPSRSILNGSESDGEEPRPFGADDILGVSEVGIAVPDVLGVVDTLEAAGAGVYGEQRSATFTPAGHIDGMVVLVNPGRAWFPTEDHHVEEQPVLVRATAPTTGPGAVTPGTYELASGRTLVVEPR